MFNRKNSIQDMDAFVEERLSDYLDGTLSAQERATVESYLAQSERARARRCDGSRGRREPDQARATKRQEEPACHQ